MGVAPLMRPPSPRTISAQRSPVREHQERRSARIPLEATWPLPTYINVFLEGLRATAKAGDVDFELGVPGTRLCELR